MAEYMQAPDAHLFLQNVQEYFENLPSSAVGLQLIGAALKQFGDVYQLPSEFRIVVVDPSNRNIYEGTAGQQNGIVAVHLDPQDPCIRSWKASEFFKEIDALIEPHTHSMLVCDDILYQRLIDDVMTVTETQGKEITMFRPKGSIRILRTNLLH